jgi:hypothetical protein
LVCILLLSAAALQSCHKETEEDRIAKTVRTIGKAAGNKDIKGMLSALSKTYLDPQGNDYQAIKNLLLFYFFRHQKVSVIISDIEPSVDGLLAEARFQAVLAGGGDPNGTILPEALGAFRFHMIFKKESGEWMVTSATWKRIGETSE